MQKKILRKGIIRLGLAVISVGAVSLILSYIQSSTILTFIGLGLTLWGLLLFYISQPKSIPSKAYDIISFSMLSCIDAIVDRLYHVENAVHLYYANGNGSPQGYIYFAHCRDEASSDLTRLYKQETLGRDLRGDFIPSPNQGLLDLLERELNVDLAKIGFASLERTLPDVLVEQLKLVDYFLIEENVDNTFEIQFSGEPSIHLCRLLNEKSKIGYRLGCPICGLLALALSKITGRPVKIKETITESDGSAIRTVYEVITS